MKTNQIRSAFLNYFNRNNHTIVPAGSLVPGNDPSLLFTNAGMVPFKDVFLGEEKRPYVRATSSQLCVRAGGKHNDLENVGYTARHHTLFEMLGNFSFGDYFKREAIQFGWKFLTEELGLSPDCLWVTVFREDDEAADIWLKEIGIDPNRFSRCDEDENFWSMGDTGPCGPCSEIFYDHGESVPGGPPGSPDADGDRYVEIWNLVFMQYDRAADGELKLLPKPSVDTGMGLERIASVMQGVHSNYDTDTFQHLIKATEKVLGVSAGEEGKRQSFNVIADHIRAATFLISDGMTPSNEHRGYVLRRIIRRALRHGHKLGANEPFFYKLVEPLIDEMGETYPQLKKASKRIQDAIKQEEGQFLKTLSHGMKLLNEALKGQEKVLPGKLVFQLYDTHGFPPDLTADIAREHNMEVDQAEFDKCMKVQQKRSQQCSHFVSGFDDRLCVEGKTEFTGYDSKTGEGKILYLFKDCESVKTLEEGEEGMAVLDKTPFYAESGGQVGDSGEIKGLIGSFAVQDTQKQGKVFLHHGKISSGKLTVGDVVQAEVSDDREATKLNHSATHLLHAALREVLGDQVIQKGSLVEPARLRFDFAYSKPMTQDQIKTVERLVNQKIRDNLDCRLEVTSQEEALQKGALALFGEKYDDEVRMLSMGGFSIELCGGTHVQRTGEIGLFKITSETGIASGVRRIEAVTGQGALDWVEQTESDLSSMMSLLKANKNNVLDKLKQNMDLQKILTNELDKAKQLWASANVASLEPEFQIIQSVPILLMDMKGLDASWMSALVDAIKSKKDQAVVLLLTVNDQHVRIAAGVTKSLTKQIKAGDLVRYVAEQFGGKGGGRPDWAQGAGVSGKVDNLQSVLESVKDWLANKL